MAGLTVVSSDVPDDDRRRTPGARSTALEGPEEAEVFIL